MNNLNLIAAADTNYVSLAQKCTDMIKQRVKCEK